MLGSHIVALRKDGWLISISHREYSI